MGQLGVGDKTNRLGCTQVFEASKIVTVAAGGEHSMAVGENGALWAWGLGSSGQLGLGDTNSRRVPTQVGAEEVFGGYKVRMAACGYVHTLVLKEEGEQWRPRSARSTGPQRRARQAGADARGPAALCPRTHLRRCRWLPALGSRDSGRRPLHMGQR